MRQLVLMLSLCAALPASATTAPDLAPVRKWLAGQATARTVQADFTQTRSFHALRDPIASPGHLWYSAPHSFRWELGDPPKTIVLRQGDRLYVIQPAKKHAEQRSAADVTGQAGGAGNADDGLSLRQGLRRLQPPLRSALRQRPGHRAATWRCCRETRR